MDDLKTIKQYVDAANNSTDQGIRNLRECGDRLLEASKRLDAEFADDDDDAKARESIDAIDAKWDAFLHEAGMSREEASKAMMFALAAKLADANTRKTKQDLLRNLFYLALE